MFVKSLFFNHKLKCTEALVRANRLDIEVSGSRIVREYNTSFNQVFDKSLALG